MACMPDFQSALHDLLDLSVETFRHKGVLAAWAGRVLKVLVLVIHLGVISLRVISEEKGKLPRQTKLLVQAVATHDDFTFLAFEQLTWADASAAIADRSQGLVA